MKMVKKLSMILSFFLLFAAGYAQVIVVTDATPWVEGFESNGTNFPASWTQETVQGTDAWEITQNGAHNGDYKAAFPQVDNQVVKLISPKLDLSGVTDPALTLWHSLGPDFMGTIFGNPQPDLIKVYYKTSVDGNWNFLKECGPNPESMIPSWIGEEEIILPNPTDDYYLAFEAIARNRATILLDDIEVGKGATPPLPDEPMAFGYIYAPAGETGYVSFDLANILGYTQIKSGAEMPNLMAGDFFKGKLYAYESGEGGTVTFHIIDAATGNVITSVARPELQGKTISDMAYDYSSDKMYALIGNDLSTVDLSSGALTLSCVITGISGSGAVAMAIDLEGNMFGVSGGMITNFYTINKTTGTVVTTGAMIGFFSASGAQSMNFDHNEGTLYWCQSGATNNFRSLNKATGAATTIMANTPAITCFHVPYYKYDIVTPAAVTDFTVTANASGALNAVLEWTNPTETYGGSALTELTAVNIYQNGTLIHSISNPTIGGTGTYTVNVTASENYTFKIVGENSEGEGEPVIKTVWIGEDVPGVPTNVIHEKNGLTATLTWEAPTVGLNGGYFTGEDLSYDVYRLPGNHLVGESLTVTTFSETVTQYGSISYKIVAKNDLNEGGSATSEAHDYFPTISTFPWICDFEDNGTSLPYSWKNEFVVGNMPWSIIASSTGTPGAAPEGGSYKARMQDYNYGYTSRLITPAFDLTQIQGTPVLSFWHVQRTLMDGQDELRIYYKSAYEGQWTLLETYTNEVYDWTEREIELSEIELSDDFYFCFEGVMNNGWGVHLDNIKIRGPYTGPAFKGSSELAFDKVPNNINETVTKAYTFSNVGVTDLVVDFVSSSPDITITGLPVTVPPGETGSFEVSIDVSALQAGDITRTFVIETNDETFEELTVTVKATIYQAVTSGYVFLDYDESGVTMPAGWAYTRFFRQANIGIDGSGALGGNIYATDPTGTVTSCFIDMGDDPELSFWYKGQLFSGSAPAGSGSFKYRVEITTNGANWDILEATEFEDYVSSAEFAKIDIDVEDYANQFVQVRIVFLVNNQSSPVPDLKIVIDDLSIGTMPGNDLTAVSVTGNATPSVGVASDYTVTIKNWGSVTQNNYTVKLMKVVENGDDYQLAFISGTEIVYKETKQFVIPWTPTFNEEGAGKIYAEIEFEEDEFINDNKTSVLMVNVLPSGVGGIQIGTGTSGVFLPYNFFWRKSFTQSLYYPNEFGTNGGTITSLVYKANLTGPTLPEYMPIRVWMREVEAENLKDGWIDFSAEDLETYLVFDGIKHLEYGINDLEIPLIEPFQYHGGTIVIYSQKLDAAHGWSDDRFYGTVYENSYRTREIWGDGVIGLEWDAVTPPEGAAGNIVHAIPNTTFMMDLSDMGKLSGVVTNGTVPLENVKVQIGGTKLYKMTNENGEYAFNYLVPGDYTVTASLLEYGDENATVSITANGEEVQNFVMSLRPLVKVKGTVTANDGSGGLENVAITLSGYYDNVFTATTNENGYYEIDDVYGDFTYYVKAELEGWQTYIGTVDVGSAETLFNFTINEMAHPVYNLSAIIEGANAKITWTAAGALIEKKYIFDDGTVEGGWSMIPGMGNIGLGNKFEVDEAGTLTSLDLYGFHNANTGSRMQTIDIYDANQTWIGGSEPFYLPSDAWTTIPLNNIPYSGTFYAMVTWPNDGTGATNGIGYDGNGSNANANLDYLTINGDSWFFAHERLSSDPFVLCIRANALVAGNEKTYNITSESIAETPQNNRAFEEEYVVYRLLKGETNIDNWVLLDNEVTETEYVDIEWTGLDSGVYQYAVVAKYTNDVWSDPALSNELPKGMEVSYKVNITTNAADTPVAGAIVTLTNHDGISEHVYTDIATSNEVHFPKIWKGVYDLTITLEGFEPYIKEDINIFTEELFHNAVLTEIIVTPFGLKIIETGHPAERLFRWNSSFSSTYTLDNGDAEDGWTVPTAPNGNEALGNRYITNDEGFITSVDVYALPSAINTERKVTVRIYDETQTLVGESEEFVLTANAWVNVPLKDIHYSGTFYAMVYWPNTPGVTHYLGYCTNGSQEYKNDNCRWTSEGFAIPFHNTESEAVPGVFMIRVNAQIFGKYVSYEHEAPQRAVVEYVVYLNDGENNNEVDATTETEYLFTNLSNKTYTAGVKAVYLSGETEIVYSAPFTVNVIAYNVIVENDGNGTATATPSSAIIGTEITLVATPNEKYQFKEWEVISGELTIEDDKFLMPNNDVIVKAHFIPMEGIDDIGQAGFTVYPNPAKDLLTLVRATSGKAQIEIYTVHGALIKRVEINDTKAEINVSSLPAGFYMIRLTDNKIVSTQRFVKE